MVLVLGQSSWTMWTVKEQRRDCLTASIRESMYTTVDTTKMLESSANVSKPPPIYQLMSCCWGDPLYALSFLLHMLIA